MRKVVLLSLVLLAGCGPTPTGGSSTETIPAVLAIQKQAYAETVTGRFLSLADLEENSLTGEPAHRQAEAFSVQPPSPGAETKFVVNITRTGVGAVEAALPPGSELVFRLAEVHDFSTYTLLAAAVYSREIRGDFHVTLESELGNWQSPGLLLREGWNDVLIDLHRLNRRRGLDLQAVRSIRMGFSPAASPGEPPGQEEDAAGQGSTRQLAIDVTPEAEPTTQPAGESLLARTAPSTCPSQPVDVAASQRGVRRINVDDVLLIDNRREITPVPEGMRLSKVGLDYELSIPGRREPLRLAQSDDGLWRLGRDQPLLAAFRPDRAASRPARAPANDPESVLVGENLSALGDLRVGEVQLLEHNAIRVRLANTWYFPTSTAQWLSLGIRQVRWEYTFYRDGRWITDVLVNFAGGPDVTAYRLTLAQEAIWSDGQRQVSRDFVETATCVDRRSFLIAQAGEQKELVESSYVKPPRIEMGIGKTLSSQGDLNLDRYDEGQGCFHVQGQSGLCRFRLVAPRGACPPTVIHASGNWQGPVAISSDGLAIREYVELPDGSILFILPGFQGSGRWIEISGTPAAAVDK